MPFISGDEADRRSEGGEKPSNWNPWNDHDTISVKSHKDDGGELIARSGSSNESKSDNHIHFYNNPDSSSEHHKSDHEVGTRLAEVKSNGEKVEVEGEYISEKLGNAVRNFLGF
jgi:hypothetical protein